MDIVILKDFTIISFVMLLSLNYILTIASIISNLNNAFINTSIDYINLVKTGGINK